METKPQKPSSTAKQTPENHANDIHRKPPKPYSSEPKILITMEVLRGEEPVTATYSRKGRFL